MDETSSASAAHDFETLRDAMAGFLAANNVPVDGGASARSWSPVRGFVRMRLPNFKWRRHAIARHDVHHLLTGYPCTLAGEMQMAAWEFAAGRFPNAGATAFCLPLVGLGAVLLPRRAFRAFVRGRCGRTLYSYPLTDDLFASTVAELRERFAPIGPQRATLRESLAYLRLVGLSFAWIFAPAVLLWLAFRFAAESR